MDRQTDRAGWRCIAGNILHPSGLLGWRLLLIPHTPGCPWGRPRWWAPPAWPDEVEIAGAAHWPASPLCPHQWSPSPSTPGPGRISYASVCKSQAAGTGRGTLFRASPAQLLRFPGPGRLAEAPPAAPRGLGTCKHQVKHCMTLGKDPHATATVCHEYTQR